MRKAIVPQSESPDRQSAVTDAGWLDVETMARVELTSEDASHPFEQALRADAHEGWKASEPGPQVIRIHFDEPVSMRRIRLQFREDKRERAQEFALFAISADGTRKEIVRQQWTFSPGHSSVENEEYAVELAAVSAIVLEIDPGRHDKQAIATLQSIAFFG